MLALADKDKDLSGRKMPDEVREVESDVHRADFNLTRIVRTHAECLLCSIMPHAPVRGAYDMSNRAALT